MRPEREPTPGTRMRVCTHCGLGLVLQAVAAIAPAPGASFLVIDRELRISALSQAAQELLAVSESAGAGRPLTQFITSAASEPYQRADFLASLRGAAEGIDALRRFSVRVLPTDDPPLTAVVGACGPPPAALLVLGLA
jgi:PAS domain-containing protein